MTREEVIKVLEYALECVDEETPKGADEAEAIPMAIEALQTDIVRCGECKDFHESKDPDNPWSLCGGRTVRAIYVEPDDFCSDGRRKE